MNTKEMAMEQVSAFADGEIPESQVSNVLASLYQSEGQADWEIYHQIGDVLRSDDMAVSMSPGFSAKMAAALADEPALVAPVLRATIKGSDGEAIGNSSGLFSSRQSRRWTMPGMLAAAAVAAVAFVATPQLMVAMKSVPVDTHASVRALALARADAALAVKVNASSSAVASSTEHEGVVLRDPRIDDYLLAHQRFSPSVYSTAQYARSATFANDSNK